MRSFFHFVIIFWLTFGALEAVAEDSDSASWPRFLGDGYDGVARDADLQLSGSPQLAWSLEVGDGYGIGSLAGGRYYHFDAEIDSQGRTAERLRCIDLQSGEPLWSVSNPIFYRDLLGYEDGPRSSPTLHDGRVYTLGVTGHLICRDMASGEQIWMVDTNERYGVVQNFFGVGSSPLVVGEQLIVMVGGSPEADQEIAPMRLDRVSPNGSAVVSFDLQTGRELWKCGDDLASYSSPRPLQLDDETYVLLFARGGLLLVDPRTRKVLWRFDHRARILESVNAMTPVVVGDRVFISECYEVGSVLLKAGRENAEILWQDPRNRRQQAFRAHWATPIVIAGNLYGCSGRNAPDSDFRCVDFATGQVRWIDPRRTRCSITQVGDRLLLLEERGLLQLIEPDPKSLRVIEEWDLSVASGNRPAIRYPCWAAPIVAGNRILLRGTSNVLCLLWGE